MDHSYETSKTCMCGGEGGCRICDGGLSLCRVCVGLEGGLPTECPGRPLTWAEGQAVYHGKMDFRGGRWVDAVTRHMAHAYPGRAGEALSAEALSAILAAEE